jgi:hypothetical protein
MGRVGERSATVTIHAAGVQGGPGFNDDQMGMKGSIDRRRDDHLGTDG